jgi:hypothetical protein
MLPCLAGAAGRLEFEALIKEVHAPVDAATVVVDFPFSNKSGKTVTIRRHESYCSCMSVSLKEGKTEYRDGESGVVRAVFDMGNFSGEIDKAVGLFLDGDGGGEPSVVLTARVHIPVVVEAEPRTLRWTVGDGGGEKRIRIRMRHTRPVCIVKVSCTSAAFRFSHRAVKEGEEYELAIAPVDAGKPGLAVFRIETDCDVAKHRVQQVFAVIQGRAAGAAGE